MKGSNLAAAIGAIIIVLLVIELGVQAVTLSKIASLGHLPGGGPTNGTAKNQSHGSTLRISATGYASAQPTIGQIELQVQGRGLTGAAATANLSAELAQMNQSVYKYLEGNISNIQTTYYNLYNESSYYYPCYGCGQTYNGYVAMESLQINIPSAQNLSKASAALSAVNGLEITSSSDALSNAQTTALRSAAFSDALNNATSQAEALTGNAMLTMQNITVGYFNVFPVPLAASGAGSASSSNGTAAPVPQYYSGPQGVTESITVVFAYKS